MKKVLLWIGGIALVLVLAFIVVVILLAANVLPLSVTKTSLSQDYGYDGAYAPSQSPMPREWDAMPGSAAVGKGYDESANVQQGERVIIRSARLSLVASDVQKTVSALKTYTEQNNGFVVSAEVQTQEDMAPRATVSLRIPAERLDAALAFIRQQALCVTSESVSGEDVTEEYVDLKARLSNLEASERQFLTIMKDARKTEDVLSVQREIERVRGEIESLTARKKYLEESAKLSSVVISIATDEASLPVVDAGDEWRPFVVAKSAAAAFLDMLKFLVNVVIWAIVFVPIWGTAWLVVRYWKRRRLSIP